MSINLTDELLAKTKKGKIASAKQIFLEGDTQTVEKEIKDINSRHDTLNTKHDSLSKTVQGISATGKANTATEVTYNNTNSGIVAENIQDAVDKLAAKDATKAEKADVTSQMQTEQTRVNAELAKKFNSENIAQESGVSEDKVMSQKAVSDKLSDLLNATNTKVFTTSSVANKVLRKLFLDTSNYSGSNSLEGLYIGIINKGNSKNGLQFRNSEGITILSHWMEDENPIMDIESEGIYVHAEFNWDNMKEGNLQTPPFIMTNEVYNKANDPRNKITNKYIADKSVTTGKLADDILDNFNSLIPYERLEVQPNYLSFNAGNVLNLLDDEGFNQNPTVFRTSKGDAVTPVITIEDIPNILGLPYSRCFTVKDEKYNDAYYIKPYATVLLDSLKNVKAFSFSFFIKYDYFTDGNIFYVCNNKNMQVAVKYNTTSTFKANKDPNLGTNISIIVKTKNITIDNESWCFVKGTIEVENMSAIQDLAQGIAVNFLGGEDNIGKKTVTCGWTIVKGLVDLQPFQYYPYGETFYERFTKVFELADNAVTTEKLADNAVTTEKLADDIFIYNTTLYKKIYGQIGDSISEGAGLTQLLQDNDKFSPITGTKKATYGYYIAKLNNMKWFNYGISGSTLGFVTVGGNDKNGFSKENGRYTKLDDSLTHISIFFGWNDAYYGPIMKKEEWLYNRYNKSIYYPTSEDLIGTVASDGTPYTTQSQYEEVNKVVGEFNGVTYTESSKYFQALYVGTSKDITNKTFWGAWNIVLPYIINKYPLAKILLIVPYRTYPLLRQCVRDAAIKYGLTIYDFSDTKNQTFFGWDDVKSEGLINNKSISQFRMDTLTADGVHPNDKGYEYMYPSINAKLMEL